MRDQADHQGQPSPRLVVAKFPKQPLDMDQRNLKGSVLP